MAFPLETHFCPCGKGQIELKQKTSHWLEVSDARIWAAGEVRNWEETPQYGGSPTGRGTKSISKLPTDYLMYWKKKRKLSTQNSIPTENILENWRQSKMAALISVIQQERRKEIRRAFSMSFKGTHKVLSSLSLIHIVQNLVLEVQG